MVRVWIFLVEMCWVRMVFRIDEISFVGLGLALSRFFAFEWYPTRAGLYPVYNNVPRFIYLLNECMKNYYLSWKSLNRISYSWNTSTECQSNRKRSSSHIINKQLKYNIKGRLSAFLGKVNQYFPRTIFSENFPENVCAHFCETQFLSNRLERSWTDDSLKRISGHYRKDVIILDKGIKQ